MVEFDIISSVSWVAGTSYMSVSAFRNRKKKKKLAQEITYFMRKIDENKTHSTILPNYQEWNNTAEKELGDASKSFTAVDRLMIVGGIGLGVAGILSANPILAWFGFFLGVGEGYKKTTEILNLDILKHKYEDLETPLDDDDTIIKPERKEEKRESRWKFWKKEFWKKLFGNGH